jgi:hypothetical protein
MSGCLSLSPKSRELEIHWVSVREEGGNVDLTVEYGVQSRNMDSESASFPNTELVGYTGEQDVVCTEELGTITGTGTVEMLCPEVPTYLTFTSERDPCEDTTTISVYKFTNSDDKYQSYAAMEPKRCTEPTYASR